ncbi:HIT family protein [soil metagenome]
MLKQCLICERINTIKDHSNLFYVTELTSGYVVMGDHQFYKGYALLLSKEHKKELHELSFINRQYFLADMAILAEAIYKVFHPNKLNYELLGNEISHLHWHIFPRYNNDPKPTLPIWALDQTIREAAHTVPTITELTFLKKKLLHEINNLIKNH